MKPTPIRRILWVLAILLVLALLMAGLARAEPCASPTAGGAWSPSPRRRSASSA